MSYLDKLNRFASNPVNLDLKRSTFKRPFEMKCTMKEGKLYPIMVDEVLPGDTYRVDVNSLIRSITPAVPVMDNAYADIFAFWVPNRIATLHPNDWQKICGENFNTAWAPVSESTLSNTGNTVYYGTLLPHFNSIAAYMGVAPYMYEDRSSLEDGDVMEQCEINTMPFIAYAKIWNEWFRDQNVQSPIVDLQTFAHSTAGQEDGFLSVNRFHDYFTSALPAPQKADSVLLPLMDFAPVITGDEHIKSSSTTGTAIKFRSTNNVNTPVGQTYFPGSGSTMGELHASGNQGTINTNYAIQPSNLWADLRNSTATSVNQIRQAFAIQRLFEKDARGGSRFREMLRAQYGVSIPDNTVQVPEYLGGKRISLNMQQVIQNSETSTTPLGTTGAFSNTFDSSNIVHKSFSEHGYIIVLCCIRTQNTYSQGINRMFLRNRRFDWYYPVFANLGEQGVKKIELYVPSSVVANNDYMSGTTLFGYQEAWAEYRYKPSMVAGYLHPDSGDTLLTPWTYTNRFTAIPTLNSSFMVEGAKKIANTLAVESSDQSYQFICDFYFDMTCRRVMPLYSIPGLVDHH